MQFILDEKTKKNGAGAGEPDGINVFGFTLTKKNNKKKEEEKNEAESFVGPSTDDGSTVFVSAGSHQIAYHDLGEYKGKSDIGRILKYREIANFPECDQAIEEIINEMVVSDDEFQSVEISLDNLEGVSDKVKKSIKEEFDNILTMLQFSVNGHDHARKWYVDGRIVFHNILNEQRNAIIEVRPIDPVNIKKIKEVEEVVDPRTRVKTYKTKDEYFLYTESADSATRTTSSVSTESAIKIAKDSIVYVSSGLMDESRKNVISFLHKAIKPVNQLRMLEDSLVIYRLVRAPERRVFRIDVGGLPGKKAEAYLESVIAKYRNKITYNANTGELADGRQSMAMIEDFWLPSRGGSGTDISTLSGGENLSQIEDILYFQRKMFRSLNVPISRMETETQFSLGRSSEITRDEIKFSKFIARLRARFSDLFYQLLRVQLILKNIITPDEWDEIKERIFINFLQDNHFTELKEAEIIRERLGTLREIDEYVGKYFSKEWVKKNVLRQSDDDIDEIGKQIDKEKEEEPDEDEDGDSGFSNF